jgi:hypothetical protein
MKIIKISQQQDTKNDIYDPESIPASEYKKMNPHTGGALTGNAQLFDRLPENALVWVFHATNKDNAESLLLSKKQDITPPNLGFWGTSNMLYVGSDPVSVTGYGNYILGLLVRKGDLVKPPEAQYKKTIGEAIVDASVGATLTAPPLKVKLVDITDKPGQSTLLGEEAMAKTAQTKIAQKYTPPMNYEKLIKKYPHLIDDEVHAWRAKTGIELIHREPDSEELHRIWKNWNLMSPEMKQKSDEKSLEMFGISNKDHYNELIKELLPETED